MKIGIFGGSFNPAHMGHFEIIRLILASKKVNKVVIVPNYTNPLKSDFPPIPMAVKWKIIQATFAKLDNIILSDHEIRKNTPSFTINTLQYFKSQYPKDQLFLILGDDAFQLFPKWCNPEKIVSLAKLIVIPRPGLNYELAEKKTTHPNIEYLPIKIPDISASVIRDASIKTISEKKMMSVAALNEWKKYILENH